jgi:hypothetical protein
MMNLVMGEAIRKICQLFLVTSSRLQNENGKLKTKVEQMEEDMKTITEKAEHYRMSLAKVEAQAEPKGPTHVLHNGIIFAIKPLGKCYRPTVITVYSKLVNLFFSHCVERKGKQL